MNGLHDLLATIKKIEEAGGRGPQEQVPGAPTTFIPTHFHKSNVGTTIPLMLAPDGKFWWQSGGQIVPWSGYPENRSPINPSSVDGTIDANGQKAEFPAGTTYKTAQAPQSGAAANPMQKDPAQQAQDQSATTQSATTQSADAQPSANADNEKLKTNIAANQTYSQVPPAQNTTQAQPTAGALTAADVTKKIATIKQIIGMKESIVFKSKIASALLESFDLGLDEDQAGDAGQSLAQLNQTWSDVLAWAKANPQDPLNKDIDLLRDPVMKWQASQQQSTVTQTAPAAGGIKVNPHDGQQGTDQPAAQPAQSSEVLQLAKDSGIADPNKIKPGQIVKTPNGDYTVVPGDTLWGISKGQFKGTPPGKPAQPPLQKGGPDTYQKIKPAVDQKASPSVTTPSANPIDTITKAVPKPTIGDKFWVDGVRYEFETRPHASPGWKQNDPTWSADRTTRGRANRKYTGPDSDKKVAESGFSNDELNRIVSLVHHR